MTHADGCPAAHNPRHGCTCRGWLPVEIAGGTTQTSSTDAASSYPLPPSLPTSVAPAGEDHGAPIRQYGARGPLSDPPSLGEYVVVTYADHVDSLAVAEKKGYHVGYKSAAGEFLTPESLAVTGMDDPRYAKGHADAVAECLVSDRERMEAQVAAYDRGRADEREAAAQRVEALRNHWNGQHDVVQLNAAVSAVRGDSDE